MINIFFDNYIKFNLQNIIEIFNILLKIYYSNDYNNNNIFNNLYNKNNVESEKNMLNCLLVYYDKNININIESTEYKFSNITKDNIIKKNICIYLLYFIFYKKSSSFNFTNIMGHFSSINKKFFPVIVDKSDITKLDIYKIIELTENYNTEHFITTNNILPFRHKLSESLLYVAVSRYIKNIENIIKYFDIIDKKIYKNWHNNILNFLSKKNIIYDYDYKDS
jgi:hypothetical protein